MDRQGTESRDHWKMLPSLKRNLKWEFVPTVKVGDEVETGDVIGTVQETVLYRDLSEVERQ